MGIALFLSAAVAFWSTVITILLFRGALRQRGKPKRKLLMILLFCLSAIGFALAFGSALLVWSIIDGFIL